MSSRPNSKVHVCNATLQPFISTLVELGVSVTGSSVRVLTVHIFVRPLYIAAAMNKLGVWPFEQLICKTKTHKKLFWQNFIDSQKFCVRENFLLYGITGANQG